MTQPTAPSEAIRQGEIEFVDTDGGVVTVELPAGGYTGAKIADLRSRILRAADGLRVDSIVVADDPPHSFLLIFGHNDAEDRHLAVPLRRRLAAVLRARFTALATVSGLVDRAPTRNQIGTTVTFKFEAGERPNLSRDEIMKSVGDVFDVTINAGHNTIALSMGTPTRDDAEARAFAARAAEFLRARIVNAEFTLEDRDPSAAAYPEFDFDPESRNPKE